MWFCQIIFTFFKEYLKRPNVNHNYEQPTGIKNIAIDSITKFNQATDIEVSGSYLTSPLSTNNNDNNFDLVSGSLANKANINNLTEFNAAIDEPSLLDSTSNNDNTRSTNNNDNNFHLVPASLTSSVNRNKVIKFNAATRIVASGSTSTYEVLLSNSTSNNDNTPSTNNNDNNFHLVSASLKNSVNRNNAIESNAETIVAGGLTSMQNNDNNLASEYDTRDMGTYIFQSTGSPCK